MQSSINRDGFLPPDPDELVEEGELPFADAVADATSDDDDLRVLQGEVRMLQARIGLLKQEAETALKARATRLDTSAHAQLGSHPWLKLAATTGAAFIVARFLQKLPVGMLIAELAGRRSYPRRF